MVVINLIPFVKLDGYWILQTILDVPNLYNKALKSVFKPLDKNIYFDNREVKKRSLIMLFGYTIIVSFIIIIYTTDCSIDKFMGKAGRRDTIIFDYMGRKYS